MAALLMLLLVMVFVVPFVTTPISAVGRILQDVLLSLILLNGTVLATDRPSEFVPIGLVGLVAIVMRWASWFAPASFATALRDEATPLALGFLAVTLAMRVFGAERGQKASARVLLDVASLRAASTGCGRLPQQTWEFNCVARLRRPLKTDLPGAHNRPSTAVGSGALTDIQAATLRRTADLGPRNRRLAQDPIPAVCGGRAVRDFFDAGCPPACGPRVTVMAARM
jgi:hypothetical protein